MPIWNFDQFCNLLDENRKSMSRLLTHVGNDPFVIVISVERSPFEIGHKAFPKLDYQNSKNVEQSRNHGASVNALNTSEFRRGLSQFHSGFIKIEGQYKETTRIDNIDVETDVHEQSTIVYCSEASKDELYQYCIKFAKRTNQECILFIEKGKGYYLNPRTLQKDYIGIFYPDKFGEYYSILVQRNHKTGRQQKAFTFVKDTSKISSNLKRLLGIKDAH